MKVKELMVTRNLVTVRESDTAFLVGQLMQWRGVRHVPVLREDGAIAGIISARDLAVFAAGPTDHERVLAKEIMQREVEVVVPDDELSVAAATMASQRIGCAPVVEKGKLVGILTATDLVGHAVSSQIRERAAAGTQVGAIMRRVPLTVMPHGDLLDAVGLMTQHHVRHLPVVDAGRRLIGMLSDRDVRTTVGDPVRAVEEWASREKGPLWTVAEAMTLDPVAAHPEDAVSDVARKLADERVGAVVIVDGEERVVGIVSYVDVLRGLRVGEAHGRIP